MTHGDGSVGGSAGPSRPGVAAMLVGRDRELGLIGSFLGQAAAEGGVLLFTGEPGVGKTVMLDAAVSATAAGTSVLRTAGGEFNAEVNFSARVQNMVGYPLE